ncbi:MAG: hypothetical protein ACRDT6_16155 [Micromonosporaceae bacterium]
MRSLVPLTAAAEPVLLDWRACRVSPRRRPCVLCGRLALLLSPSNKPCHKVCAERWIAARAAKNGLEAA